VIKKELFVCDRCGERKRLASMGRHWCDFCSGPPPEMRAVKDKRFQYAQISAP
jgi:hypothetical protein